ncbi:MAG: cation-translocating P-type ATPase [Clostridia bacterium]|nr:cation-translocating P-type ATPase [Clostridia bacterium]
MQKLRVLLKKLNDFLAGLPMTIVGGVALVLSFVLPRIGQDNLSWQNFVHWHYTYNGRVVHGGAEFWSYLAWITVIICGIPMLYLAIWRIIHNKGIAKINSALLISVAMIASISIGDLFAAGEVAFIMSVGALLEDMTTERAQKGLKNLIGLTPKTANLIRNGEVTVVPAETLTVGDTVRVLPGETIPADGVILSGETSVDQSIMTGESLPVDKTAGDEVYCGTINRFGAIELRVTKAGEDSSLKKMIRLVEEARQNQAPVQRIADRWASWLVPVAMMIAIICYFITGEINRTVTVLVVFCPCALILATPTAVLAAIGQATKHGVIIKSGESLEKLGHIDTFAFDKTGTLTHGRLNVTDTVAADGIDREQLLGICASAEMNSEHPLGKAITACAREEGITLQPCENFVMTLGRGIRATVGGKAVCCGSESYMREAGIVVPETMSSRCAALRQQGKAIVLVSCEKKIIGLVALADTMREGAKEMIGRLHEMNVKTVLLTGDHKTTAQYVAQQAGISDVRAELLPEDKVRLIREMNQSGAVCMIGDGVNDAPAIKTASVGVAMGCMGSDIAVEAADVALMTDDISRIPYLKRLSKATVRTIQTCITISMCINACAVTLSVLGMLTPTTGALVHNAGSTFVVLLAALLYDRKFDGKGKK